MNTLYPTPQTQTGLKTRSTVFIALFIMASGVANAQQNTYASITSSHTQTGYTTGASKVIEPVIKVKARSEKKIVLSWAPFRGAVSHYVLERSTDGRTYHEAGIFFTGEWDEEPEYYYTDKFKNAYTGDLYYRLRVVGLEGSVIYTPVTVLSAEPR